MPQVSVRSPDSNLGTEWIRADRVDIGTPRAQVSAQQPGVNLGHRAAPRFADASFWRPLFFSVYI